MKHLTALLLYLVALPVFGNDTESLKNQFRNSNGGTLKLKSNHTYEISEKLELKQLCPGGVRIEGNGSTIKAVGDFQHPVLLTANVLLKDEPYDAGVAIRNLTLDGNGKVGMTLFGHWKRARLDNLKVLGGNVYQMNAIFKDSLLTRIHVDGNPEQTNNGFDCSLQHSTVYDVTVDMHGNRTESAFWLNGCEEANVINSHFIDGRTAFGLENCKGVNVRQHEGTGRIHFSRRQHSTGRAIGTNPSLQRRHRHETHRQRSLDGSSFQCHDWWPRLRRSHQVDGARAVLLSHGATGIGVFNVDLRGREPVSPQNQWVRRSSRLYASGNNGRSHRLMNHPPVVFAGANRVERITRGSEVVLAGVVADEKSPKDLKIQWTQKDGPARAKLKSTSSPETAVTFPKNGVYHFVLSADDGKRKTEDDVKIKVIRSSERLTKSR